jgi:hypothetical protein
MQPVSQSVTVGQTVTFSVTPTSGTVPLILNVLKPEAQQREEKEHV